MAVTNSQDLLSVNFNQDHDCFAVGTQEGFVVHISIPLKGNFARGKYNPVPYLKSHTVDMNGGIGIVEMLYGSNIMALVGGGKSPKWPTNKVMLWDDY